MTVDLVLPPWLTDAHRALSARIYEATARERARVLGENERRLRLSA